jgi:hypothetical protein
MVSANKKDSPSGRILDMEPSITPNSFGIKENP